MKNVVFGLFEERDDARRVLRQLADSPLDLDTVQIVHRDPDVQYQLSSEIGLPADRTMPTGLIIGALLGAALGAYSGNSWLSSLGPLLAAAGGMLLGAAVGAVAGAMAETVRLPGQSSDEIVSAVDDGGTAILVRTTNLPTARAISDLFYAGGSRALSASDGSASDADLSVFAPRPLSSAESHAQAAAPPGLEQGGELGVEQGGEIGGEPGVGQGGEIGVTPTPQPTGTGEDGEEIFAPPWRRTPFAMRPSQGAVAPPITPEDYDGATALPEDDGGGPVGDEGTSQPTGGDDPEPSSPGDFAEPSSPGDFPEPSSRDDFAEPSGADDPGQLAGDADDVGDADDGSPT